MKEKLMKLLKPFQGTKQQKQRLVDFVKENSGSGSDEGIAIFECDYDSTYLSFKLLQGKPKLNSEGYLTAIFLDLYVSGEILCLIDEEDIMLMYTYQSTACSIDSYQYSVKVNKLNDFLNMKVGETILITDNIEEINYSNAVQIILSKTETFENSNHLALYPRTLSNYVLMMYSNDFNSFKIGHIVEVNTINNWFTVKFGEELCKFSYTEKTLYRDDIATITFVEVVTP